MIRRDETQRLSHVDENGKTRTEFGRVIRVIGCHPEAGVAPRAIAARLNPGVLGRPGLLASVTAAVGTGGGGRICRRGGKGVAFSDVAQIYSSLRQPTTSREEYDASPLLRSPL